RSADRGRAVLAQMEREEEETREILLPSWEGSGSHGITIAQTDDGVFVRRVQQNSPAARMGVVKEGDQIVSATVYFDKLPSGEAAQLLQTMGQHTLGLRLQRRGDRSPLPGQPCGQPAFIPGSPEVVLSGDDEEYQRIYTTKIKPRLRSEEGPDAEAGGTQSRTITVTRRVTAYTVDVTRHDGHLDVPEGLQLPPPSQIPAGETGTPTPGWKGSGACPGLPRVEANGQMAELDAGFHVSGGAPWPQGEVAGSSPPVDVGKIKIPALKIPKFGFQAGGDAPSPGVDVTCSPEVSSPSVKAPVPQVDVAIKGATKVPSPPLDVPGVEVAAPDGAKGKIKIPHLSFPKFSVPEAPVELPPGGAGPEAALEGDWKGPTFRKVETPQISLSDVNLHLRGPRAEGDLKGLGPKGLQVDVKGPEVQVASPGGGLKGVEMDVDLKGLKGGVDMSVPQLDLKGPQVGVEVPGVDIQGPGVKVPEVSIKSPQISVPDIDLNLTGPGVKGNLDVSAPKLEGELKTPGLDIKGPKVEVEAPDLDLQGPEGKLKFPKLKMPKFGVKGETPSVDVTLPKVGVDVSGPKVDVSVPSVDIKGPEVDIEAPEVDIPGPEGKFKMPKFKMPKFGMPGVKAEGPEVDVNLPKGGVEVSGPKVDIEAPSVDIQGPEMHLKAPKIS
ncbi:AHNK protein, partial [Dyaphorophyia castanea]|nr:AHNK protein [Platysteira castanea]